MLSKDLQIVVLYVGVNDVWHKVTGGTGTDLDKFEKAPTGPRGFLTVDGVHPTDQGNQLVTKPSCLY